MCLPGYVRAEQGNESTSALALLCISNVSGGAWPQFGHQLAVGVSTAFALTPSCHAVGRRDPKKIRKLQDRAVILHYDSTRSSDYLG